VPLTFRSRVSLLLIKRDSLLLLFLSSSSSSSSGWPRCSFIALTGKTGGGGMFLIKTLKIRVCILQHLAGGRLPLFHRRRPLRWFEGEGLVPNSKYAIVSILKCLFVRNPFRSESCIFMFLNVGWSVGWSVQPSVRQSPYCFSPGNLAPGLL
jgi:hypothetical protein